MKKIFIAVAFAILAMLAFNNSANATITIDFYLQITDNYYCGPNPYTGNYHITAYFLTNGESECRQDFYNVPISPYPHITWECNVDWDQYKNHSVRIVIWHWNSLTGDSCCDDVYLPNGFITDFTSGYIYQISINN